MTAPFRKPIVCLIVACTQMIGTSLQARSPIWFQERMVEIGKIGANPTDEQIDHLGILMGIGTAGDQMDEEQAEVFRNAQAKLLSVPNHAEYFGKKIRDITKAEANGTSEGKYHSTERYWQYETLSQLPSPEAVKILGELLSDESGQEHSDDPYRDWSLALANCRYAAQSLARLIEPLPYDSRLNAASDAALDTWRLWYAQVKAGTRTFKFKGSPVEYTLAGPATAAVRDSNTGSDHARSGKNTPAAGNDQAATPPGTSLWTKIATALAALLALVGGCLAFRTRSAAS